MLQARFSCAKAAASSGAASPRGFGRTSRTAPCPGWTSRAARCKRMTALLGIAGRAARNSWKVIALRSNIVSSSSCRRLSHCCREELRKRSTTRLSWSTDGVLADDADDLRRDGGSRMGTNLAGTQVFCVREQGTLSFPVKSAPGPERLHACARTRRGRQSANRRHTRPAREKACRGWTPVARILKPCHQLLRQHACAACGQELPGHPTAHLQVQALSTFGGVRALRTAASFLAMPRFTDGALSSLARTQLLFSGAYVARVCRNA